MTGPAGCALVLLSCGDATDGLLNLCTAADFRPAQAASSTPTTLCISDGSTSAWQTQRLPSGMWLVCCGVASAFAAVYRPPRLLPAALCTQNCCKPCMCSHHEQQDHRECETWAQTKHISQQTMSMQVLLTAVQDTLYLNICNSTVTAR